MKTYQLPKTKILAYRAVALQQFGTKDAYGAIGTTKQEILIGTTVNHASILKEFESILLELRKLISGLPDDMVFLYEENTKDGWIEFMNASSLWNSMYDVCETNTDIFYGRYLYFVFTNFIEHKEEILRKEVTYRYKKQSIKDEIDVLRQILQFCFEVSLDACNHKIREDNSRKLLELFLMGTVCEPANIMSFIKTVSKGTNLFKGKIRKRFFGRRISSSLPDYATLQNVFTLAYAYATGSLTFGMAYQFEEDATFQSKEDLEIALTTLGRIILEDTKNQKINSGFYLFLGSLPDCSYPYKDIMSNDELRMGCRAMSYLDFMVQMPEIHTLISYIFC